MYLRRIELQGFKTFSRRTALDLPRGITAVVGPNGSGKSNLTDAIRWALGEQGLRALRIKKFEDVIFSGSEARARTGMAEVVLTFDNEDGWLPTPYREVVVGRRLFRSGETEYYLNGARVRLRDIVDLMSAGATGHGHSMIRQGEIDALLAQRPEDRRAFLEEAAGVARFYARRDQAQQRLAITRRNLERLRDLVAEIEPRLETLRQQAEVANRGQELADELRAAQQTVVRHRLFQVANQLEAAEAREQAAAQALEAVLAEPVERLRQHAKDAEQRVAELDIEVNGARAHLARLAATVQRLATERTVRLERRANFTARLDEARVRAAGLAERIAALHARGADLDATLAELTQRMQSAAAERLELEAGLTPARQASRERARSRAQLDQARDTLATLRERARQFAATRDQMQQELAALIEETYALRRRAEAAATVAQITAGEAERASAALDAAAEAQRTARAALAAAAGLLGADERAEAVVRQRLDTLGDERRALRDFVEQAGTPAETLRALQASPVAVDLLGRLGDLLASEDPKAAALVEAAFAGALDDLVIRSPDAIPALRAALQAVGAGRVRVRPARGLRGWPFEAAERIPHDDGVLGTLADIIPVADHLPEVVQRLLEGVLVVEDLPAALRLRATHPETALRRLVTLQGDAIDLDGAIRLGKPGGGEADLRDRLSAVTRELATTETELAELAARSAARREAAAAASESVLAVDRALAARKAELLPAQALAMEAARQHQQLDAQAAARVERQQHVRDRLHDLERDLHTVHAEITVAHEAVAAHDAPLTAGPDDAAIRQAESRLAGLHAALEGMDDRSQDLTTQRHTHAAQWEAGARELAEAQRAATAAAAELAAIDQATAAAEGALAAATAAHASEEGALRALELRAVETRLDAQRLQMRITQQEWERRRGEEELTAAQTDTERLADRREELRRYALEELGVETIDPAEASTPIAALERRIAELRHLLEALGPVNPLAPAQYQEESAQVAESKRQIADLEGAESNLRALAHDLQQQLREEFVATFKAVNAEFGRLFHALFGGGEATMVLTAPSDVEQTGVEIHVRLPGKRQLELAALSGGERALVSTTLVLALLHVRPSPFCTLDEVDAALDEQNVGRFCAQLEELAQRTQFVIVTHNPVTVQSVNSVFGVTMGEDGVSQVLSLRLDDVPVPRSNGRPGGANGHASGAGEAPLPPSVDAAPS